MKLLLDTHAVLWWLADDRRLGQRARTLIADPAHDVLVSVVSLWEMVVKIRVGKLEADIGQVCKALSREGITSLGLEAAHLLTLQSLAMHHRDPFDHLLLAQSIAEDAIFLSADRHVRLYSVPAIDCLE